MSCKDSLLWKVATEDEYESLLRNEVFQLVERPDGSTRVLPGMWLFKVKLDEFGRAIRYKARYVILGNRQLLISSNTYSPVVNSLSLRILLALAVHLGLDVHHIDVKTAYLHAYSNEPVCMKQPDGYIKQGEEHLVCRLSKAIYGLRSSAKGWFTKLTSVLTDCGLKRLFTEECVFSNGQSGDQMLIVAFYDNIGCLRSSEKGGKLKNNKHYIKRLNRVRRAISDCMCDQVPQYERHDRGCSNEAPSIRQEGSAVETRECSDSHRLVFNLVYSRTDFLLFIKC